VTRLLGIVLDLAAKPGYVGVHHPRSDHRIAAPDLSQQVLAGGDHASPPYQGEEKAELGLCDIDLLVPSRHRLQRQVELISTWLGSPASREEPWTGAVFSTDGFLRLSPAELAEMGAEIQGVMDRYSGRPEAPDREPVFVIGRGFPARP